MSWTVVPTLSQEGIPLCGGLKSLHADYICWTFTQPEQALFNSLADTPSHSEYA